MLTIKQKGVLFSIIKYAKRIEQKVSGIEREAFDSNQDIKEIVCFNLFQIGELVKKLDSAFLIQYNSAPWKDIKGMRDWVGHGYNTIDWNEIWNTAIADIKPLREYCELILKENS